MLDNRQHGGEQDRTVDISALIDSSPWGWRQKLLLALVGSAVLLDGFDNQSLGLAAPAIIRDWGVSKSALAPILAIGQLGMMIGSTLGGIMGDRFGRKAALLGSVMVFAIATGAMAAAGSVMALGIMRLLAGVGLGGALPNSAALVAEYTPAHRRSVAVTATIVCIPLGGVVGGLVAAAVLPGQGWRALFLIAGLLPVLVAFVLYFSIPESSRFMLLKGADNSAIRRALARMGLGVGPDARLVDHGAGPTNRRGSVTDLLAPAFRRDTTLLWIAYGFCLLAIYAGFSWLPTMLAEAGYSLAASSRGLTVFNFGGVVAAIGAAVLIGRRGSRLPMVAMSVGGLAIAMVMLLRPIINGQAELAAYVALGLLGGCVNGVQTTLFALAAHIYPVGIRATGVGTASGVGRVGAMCSSFVGAAMLGSFGPAGFHLLMITAMSVTTLALLAIRRHSPGTRTLPASNC